MGELLRGTWRARGLITILARKDFLVRYRRASFGLLWAVGLPLLQAGVLTVVFSRIVRVDVGTNYTAFVLAALVPWSYFSSTLGAGATAIVDGSQLTSRIYFPRAVLPLVTVLANAYSLVVSTAILLVICLSLRVHLGVEVLLLIPALAAVMLLATSFSLLLSGLHVYFRDIRFVVQAGLLVWFYATPIFYPARLASGTVHGLVVANPLTGAVEIFRAATVGADADWASTVGVTLVWSAVLLMLALLLHRSRDRLFADLL